MILEKKYIIFSKSKIYTESRTAVFYKLSINKEIKLSKIDICLSE